MSTAGPPAATARSHRADKGHETRDLLLAHAADTFARLGYARTTIADITAAAQVSRPTFYAYFASREEVFREVAARARDAFLAAHELPDVDESDPWALGHAAARAFLAAHTSNHHLLTVIEHQALTDPQVAAIQEELRRRPVRRVARYLRRLQSEGVAEPATDPTLVAEAIVAMFATGAARVVADPQSFDDVAHGLTALYARVVGLDRIS